MECNSKVNLTDHDIQLFFSASEKLLKAAASNNDRAEKAIQELSAYISQSNKRIKSIEDDILQKIEKSAENTANKTATLLTEKFRQADKEAQKAAERYEQAAEHIDKITSNFNTKTWIYIILTQLVIAFTTLLIVRAFFLY